MKLKTSALDAKKYKSNLTLFQGRHLTQDEMIYITSGGMLFIAFLLLGGWDVVVRVLELVAAICIMLAFVFIFLQIDTEEEQMKKFAKANKFKFIGMPVNQDYFPRRLKDAQERYIKFLFEGTLDNGTVFQLMKIKHLRKNENMHDYWGMHVGLDGSLPEFIIDAWYNSLMIDRKSNEYHEVTLEGDFSDYFGLYLPKGTHVDVLSVMSPDVMESMMEFWNHIDIFVDGSQAWLITYRSDDKTDLQALFDAADVIVPELNHRARTYRAG